GDALDDDVQARTRELVLDLIGVALAGARQPSSPPAAHVATALGGSGEASVFGSGQKTSAVWAALANGTEAHAVELDDVTTESSLHPGVAVIPAAIALAQELQAQPKALMEAIVAGYEVTMRVGNALNPASAYARGFHPTGVAGIFGAATAASHLLQLSVDQRCLALGIAGTMASGSLEYLADGSWTKRLNAGWAAHAGVVAAQLAAGGFTGPASALDGRFGVLRGYTSDPEPWRLLAGLGEDFQIMRALMGRAECYRDPALDAGYPAVWPAAVEVETTDGRVLTERIDYFLGEPENPVAREGLVAKFVDLTGEQLGGDCALALADRILGLETQPDLARVMDELRG